MRTSQITFEKTPYFFKVNLQALSVLACAGYAKKLTNIRILS